MIKKDEPSNQLKRADIMIAESKRSTLKQSTTHTEYKKDNKNQTFKFISSTGCDIKIVKSDYRLDENLDYTDRNSTEHQIIFKRGDKM
jgi:cell fate regulator YaaT (PSP1 superfamily)